MAAHAAEGVGAAEWAALYGQYLTRAAGQSARTLELYQQVLERVARGELAPTVLQDMLAGFAQARGTSYTERLTELSMRFFSGMVQISTAYSQDLAELVLPGIAVPLAPPPPFDAADPAGWFQQLTDYAGRLSADAVKTYQSLLDRVAAGGVTPGRLQQVSSDYLQRHLPEYLRRLGTLCFDLLNGLNDVRTHYEEEYLAGVLATANRPPGEEGSFALHLAAPLGRMASASLAVANTQEEPAVVRCRVTDVRRADGVGPGFSPKITIAPERLELRPGEEASLALSLRLDEADYAPGVLYVGAVHVTGHEEVPLEVPLRITATAPTP